MLNASADLCLFFGIYYDHNDSNIYIEYHMDFLPKTANLQGGDTRKTPNLAYHGVGNYGANHGIGNYGANHGVRCRARVSPTCSLQSLPIPQITAFPLNPFQPKYPKPLVNVWKWATPSLCQTKSSTCAIGASLEVWATWSI